MSQAITVRPDIMYDGMSTGPFVDRLDFYHFVGEAGKVFVGRAEGNAGCYRLIDEGGNALGRQACSYANTVQTGPVRVELPYSGDYYFLVDHIGPSVYRFGFSLTGAAPEIGIFSYLFGDNGDPATADPLPVPEGCHGDFIYVNGSIGRVAKFTDDCYHMRTGLNNLDTTDIDFLIVPPVSIYPERDLRVMRQAVEMWVHGIHALAPDMGMEWLSAGVDFEIFIDDDNLSTDPLWDPEIVVVATNPVGGLGIGIDPIDALFGGAGPCHGQPNPLAGMDDWKGLDGFDSHHDGRSGTYSTECEGGGSVCFAVNGAIDPAPGFVASFGLYDLVAHEIGHCLTIGHVGDARDHKANAVPFADIMAYTDQDHDKCVSTLDVEGFALAMSRFLLNTSLGANDGASAAWGSFQIQHPDDHRYASPTGLAEDCEQPDADLVPGGSPGVISGQDDAGSGRDAPHDVSKAITIEPDVVYEGMSPGFILDTYDVYHFTGQAGQVFKGLSDGNTGCYSVLDAQGNYSAEKSACSYGTALNTGPIVFELPYTGDYYFKVNHVAPALYRFGFSLSGDPPVVRLLDQVPGGNPVPGQDDAGSGRDAPNDVSQAITIEPDVVYEGMSPGFGLDTYDVYHFTGQAGQVFKGLSDGNTGCYSVLDAQGNYSAEKNACSFGIALNTGPIVFELPYTGDYYFKVNHLAPAVYRFGFSLSGDPPVVRSLDQLPGGNPVPGQDDAGSGRDAPHGVSQAITIEPDVMYEGMSTGLVLDTYDVYHFVGQAGQVFKGMSDGNLGCYSVLDAEGNSSEARACSFGIALNTGPIVFELPYTG
ncbi:MAG: hypothetical protein KY455_09860, partial [Euryarchaeota archaeon]|nr:hypothetical protein [Euryarchaeota archaeon]